MRRAELLLRVALSVVAAVLAGQLLGARTCLLLRSLYRAFIDSCVPGVVVRSLDVIHEGGADLLAALLFPAQAASAATIPPGAMIVSVTVGGAVTAAQSALVVVLAWPARAFHEALIRAVMLAVLLPVLMLVGPVTLAAESLDTLRELSGQDGLPPLMVLSRLLMGGGAAALGLAAGALAVLVGRRSVARQIA